jgi:hypothetical protein
VKNKYACPVIFQFVPSFYFYHCQGRSGKNAVGSWNKVALLKIVRAVRKRREQRRKSGTVLNINEIYCCK